MVLAAIVALGGALRWSRWPRFALGSGRWRRFTLPAPSCTSPRVPLQRPPVADPVA
jgi:hypothetical protein